jgi:hypothetical protein
MKGERITFGGGLLLMLSGIVSWSGVGAVSGRDLVEEEALLRVLSFFFFFFFFFFFCFSADVSLVEVDEASCPSIASPIAASSGIATSSCLLLFYFLGLPCLPYSAGCLPSSIALAPAASSDASFLSLEEAGTGSDVGGSVSGLLTVS